MARLVRLVSASCLLTLAACGAGEAQQDALILEQTDLGNISQGVFNTTGDFSLGIQLYDGLEDQNTGDERFAGPASATSLPSQWARDSDGFDPDGARINLQIASPGGAVSNMDFAICLKARDSNGNEGTERCTPFASAGGGESGMASNFDQWDPDEYQVRIVTRAWPSSSTKKLVDFHFELIVLDESCGWWEPNCNRFVAGDVVRTPSWSQGGGYSVWANDASDNHDPDGMKLKLVPVLQNK